MTSCNLIHDVLFASISIVPVVIVAKFGELRRMWLEAVELKRYNAPPETVKRNKREGFSEIENLLRAQNRGQGLQDFLAVIKDWERLNETKG